MPARLPSKGVYATPKGEYNTKKKTFTGKGAAPSGSKKVAEPSYSEVPTVTVTSSGKVASSGYSPQKAASVARKRARATTRRARAILRPVKTSPQKAAKRSAPKPLKYTPPKIGKARAVKVAPPTSKPAKYEGKKTAGTPTLKELQSGSKSGTLKVNKKGFVTTAPVRAASRKLKKAKAVARKSQPSTKGLQPAERSVVPLARKAHRKYPDVPVSVLMAQIKQESGFNPAVISPAEAQGLSQFIPSTAASYGVRYGTGRKEQQSQVTGQAHYLHDLGFAKDPKAAMSGYTGGYSDAEYNDPVLADAKASYSALDKPGNPKAVKRLKKAKAEARKVGLRAPDVKRDGGGYVKVRADAVGAVKWAKAQVGTSEGSPKQLKWAGKTGLGSTEPWCANFVSNDLLRRGITNLPSNPNYVPSFEQEWAKYAVKPSDIRPGDLVTFSGSHIGIYVGNGEMVSGNSSDAVSRTPVGSPSMVIRPPYKKGYVRVKETAALPGALSPTASPTGVSGAVAATTAKQGSSRRVVKLTPAQKARRKLHKLDELEVGSASPTTTQTERATAPSTSELKRLEQKYSVTS